MNFLQYVHFINAEITHQLGGELNACDSDYDSDAEACDAARLHTAGGYLIDVLHNRGNPMGEALLNADVSILQMGEMPMATRARLVQRIAALNDRPLAARIAYRVETGTLSLLHNVNLGTLSPKTLAQDFAAFVGAITVTKLSLDLIVAEVKSQGVPVKLLPPPHFSPAVAEHLAGLATVARGEWQEGANYDGFLQQLPLIWGTQGANTIGDGPGVLRIDETFASYRTIDNAELYIQLLALPNRAEAVAVTAQIAQFHQLPNATAAFVAVLNTMNDQMPSGFTFVADIRLSLVKAEVTDVSLSRTILLNQHGCALAKDVLAFREMVKSMSVVVGMYAGLRFSGTEMYFASRRPVVTPGGYILPTCVVQKEARAQTAFVQALCLQHKPLNDDSLIAFADILAKSFAPPSTGVRWRSEGQPVLNLKRLLSDESISFTAFDRTEIRLTRMLGKGEWVRVAASACQISCGGMLPNGMPTFWHSLAKVTAPVDITADNGGNVVMMQTLLLAGMRKETMAEEATRFWKSVLYVRNYCAELERQSGKTGAMKITVHNKKSHPLPAHIIAMINRDRATLIQAFIRESMEEVRDSAVELRQTACEVERLCA